MSIARSLTGLLLALPMAVSVSASAAPAGVTVFEEISYEDVPDEGAADDQHEPQEIVETWDNPAPQPRGEALFRATMMRDHNRARAAVSVPPLVWEAGLAANAAAYAATLAATRTFAHARRVPGKPVQGENLWMGTRRAYGYADMTGSWVDERTDFKRGLFPDVARTKSWHEVGHYTQIIWAGTKAVGCAMATNSSDEYLVCRYFPAGNVMGRDVLTP
ncbi:MAG: serine protease [Sphingomonadales bacterium]|nr:serine protease [Sphingomonadales bacterium]